MVRGVNKKVVEVVDVEHEYFEKVILFIRDDKQEREEKLLRQEAGKYISGMRYRPPSVKSIGKWAKWKGWGLAALKLGSAAAVGAAIMSMIRY